MGDINNRHSVVQDQGGCHFIVIDVVGSYFNLNDHVEILSESLRVRIVPILTSEFFSVQVNKDALYCFVLFFITH